MPAPTLSGKRVLVLGGETPLGRALAVALAERGAGIVIASLSASTDADFAINSALNEVWALNRPGLALVIDASDAAQLRDAAARAEREVGRIDAAVAVEDVSTALDALRAALPDREVVVVDRDTALDAAFEQLIAAFD